MRIKIKLFANLQQGRFKQRLYDVSGAITFGRLLCELDIDEQETGLVLINGLQASLQSPLQAGDEVSIFPLLGGG